MGGRKKKIGKRQEAGAHVGVVALFGNIALFFAKLFAGVISNSISVIIDAFNSLLDAIANVVSILGFRRSGKRADSRHPHGHGRIEYVAGFIISMIIVGVALLFGYESIFRILEPEDVVVSFVAVLIVVLSIVGKAAITLYLYRSNRKIKSAILKASTIDSFSDVLATTVALIGLVFSGVMEFPIDGVMGLAVTGFILFIGVRSFFENFHLLVGEKPERRFNDGVRRAVLKFSSFERVLKVEFHDYGPGNGQVIIMVALRSGARAKKIEEEIAELKEKLREKYEVDSTIYWAAR